ncbi:MAG: tetratricopeptide repeat protein, partial [Pseudomonadota bacterium]
VSMSKHATLRYPRAAALAAVLLACGCQTAPERPTVAVDDSRLFRLGQCALQAAQYEEAQAYFSQAVAASPDNATYHYWLGVSQGRRADEAGFLGQIVYVRQAAKALERAAELEPGRLETQESLFEFHLHGPVLAGANRRDAERLAQVIANLDPAAGHRARGQLYQAAGDSAAAIDAYQKAMEARSGGSALLLCNLLRDLERYDEAFTVYESLSDGAAADADARREHLAALYQIGATALESRQRLEDGERALLDYLEADAGAAQLLSTPAWAHYRLGLIYELLDRPADAELQLQAARAGGIGTQLEALAERGLYELRLAREYGITVQQLRIFQTLCRVHSHVSPMSMPCT